VVHRRGSAPVFARWIKPIDARWPATVKLNPPIEPIAPGAMRQT
jgi:hypothetical protein